MWKFKAKEGEFCFVLDFSTGKCFEEDASPLCREIPSVREPRLGWVVGARRSLARLLDVLGSRAWMLVYGGMGLLVGHLGSRRGKSLSPRAMAPEMNTVGLGGLGLSHSWSSLSFSSLASPECGCFCTIRIPPAFTAGGCPAFVSSFPSGGEDMVRPAF